MSDYWSNFIKTGDPNGIGLAKWPAYTTKNNMTIILNKNPQAKPLPDKGALDFLISEIRK